MNCWLGQIGVSSGSIPSKTLMAVLAVCCSRHSYIGLPCLMFQPLRPVLLPADNILTHCDLPIRAIWPLSPMSGLGVLLKDYDPASKAA